jgi:signal transduction histidine kinase/ActR/RegA family two-component response regulator
MPVGPGTPVASIGIYWGHRHRASAYEVELLRSLAGAADLALKGVRAYEEARQARTQAEQASRVKDEFLATVSHELRTPLNAILGWTKLLQAGELDRESRHKALTTIERNARSQAQLIEDLLEVSRIITGKLRLDVRSVDLAPTVEAALDSVKLAAESKGVRLQSILDPLAGPIFGDSQRLQQVVWNLLSNAIKFTPKGGRVQVALQRINSHVEIVVGDTGEGISPDFLPHLFERFSQASSGSTRKYGGLGLGLAIVRHLVELHGGVVRAESEGEGKGATFIVKLPLMAARETIPAVEGRPPAHDGSASLDIRPVLDGIRILIVDDEADARDLLSALLKQCKAAVVAAPSAAQAREILETSHIDVIISDIEMPDEDGYSFIRWVRSNARTREIPAAALTAYARSEDRMRAILEGFQIHIPKPVEPGELIAVVATLTGRLGVDTTAE